MNEKEGNVFGIDKELDLVNVPSSDIVSRTLKGLSCVKKGHYMLVSIDNYSYIAEIAKAVVAKKATVDNVLRKGNNRWTVMIKNDVPVAQTG